MIDKLNFISPVFNPYQVVLYIFLPAVGGFLRGSNSTCFPSRENSPGFSNSRPAEKKSAFQFLSFFLSFFLTFHSELVFPRGR